MLRLLVTESNMEAGTVVGSDGADKMGSVSVSHLELEVCIDELYFSSFEIWFVRGRRTF